MTQAFAECLKTLSFRIQTIRPYRYYYYFYLRTNGGLERVSHLTKIIASSNAEIWG